MATRAPAVDWGQLWRGGIAAACVAALVAVVGLLVARGVFDVSVFLQDGDGSLVTVTSGSYAVVAFAVALLATALAGALVTFDVPSPLRFFSWIVFLFTVIAVISPLLADSPEETAIATAVINGVLGIVIGSLVTGVARAAVQGDVHLTR